MLNAMCEDSQVTEKVPLLNVSTEELRKIIEFCSHYHKEPMTPIHAPFESDNIEDLVQCWYAEFVTKVTKSSQEELFRLVAAANYLDIKPLLDLTVVAVASLIKGASPEFEQEEKPRAYIRKMFSLS